MIQTIALEGSTKDKKVKVNCHFTAFGKPHQIDWEGSLDDTFDVINKFLGGKIWNLLKNKAEMQQGVLIYHFNSDDVFERKEIGYDIIWFVLKYC